MFAAGAVLGPFCDGLHSSHDVLHYVHPTVQLHVAALHWSFETCWWVPLLFGVAGVILGVSVPLLDEVQAPQQQQQQQAGSAARRPAASWPWVLLCIALFVTQYWLSAALEGALLGRSLPGPQPGAGVPALDALLAACALALWAGLDGTPQGLAMSALTGVCGPAVEVGLIKWLGLYQYAHPAWAGAVPSWIVWVYAAGGPAVGNLGRIVWRTLKQQEQAQEQEQERRRQQQQQQLPQQKRG